MTQHQLNLYVWLLNCIHKISPDDFWTLQIQSNWFFSRKILVQIGTKFAIPTSKLCFDSILSNRKQSSKCLKQLNTQWMNAVHALNAMRAQISCFIDRSVYSGHMIFIFKCIQLLPLKFVTRKKIMKFHKMFAWISMCIANKLFVYVCGNKWLDLFIYLFIVIVILFIYLFIYFLLNKITLSMLFLDLLDACTPNDSNRLIQIFLNLILNL